MGRAPSDLFFYGDKSFGPFKKQNKKDLCGIKIKLYFIGSHITFSINFKKSSI